MCVGGGGGRELGKGLGGGGVSDRNVFAISHGYTARLVDFNGARTKAPPKKAPADKSITGHTSCVR